MSSETRTRILDAAEQLFAEKGFEATSIRDITTKAGANLAAVHYHFGSKEELLRAALGRIVEPVNAERLALLGAAEDAAAPAPAEVEAILHAFLAPDLRIIKELGERGRLIARFLGRSYTEPSVLVRQLVAQQFGELGERFHAALRRAVPEVGGEEMWWRLMAIVAVVTSMLGASPEDPTVPGPGDPDLTLRRMVAIFVPALKAPPAG